jgi:hypothetical protein
MQENKRRKLGMLFQAKEYFDASGAVTLATKPNLLYYSIMSLAIAEISGNYILCNL